MTIKTEKPILADGRGRTRIFNQHTKPKVKNQKLSRLHAMALIEMDYELLEIKNRPFENAKIGGAQ